MGAICAVKKASFNGVFCEGGDETATGTVRTLLEFLGYPTGTVVSTRNLSPWHSRNSKPDQSKGFLVGNSYTKGPVRFSYADARVPTLFILPVPLLSLMLPMDVCAQFNICVSSCDRATSGLGEAD